MAYYIPPNGVVKILRGVPLDIEHEHSLWFADRNAQYNFFNSCVAHTFTNTTYTRKGRGIIKLQINADNIYDCNYLMYQNIGFSNKWFYAYITSVEYISNTVAQISFVIDQLQTWFFEMTLGMCYVEREHSRTDNIGENLVPENLETGEYIYKEQYSPDLGNQVIVIAATFMYQDTPATEQYGQLVDIPGVYVYGGVFSGVWFNTFQVDASGMQKLNKCIITATHDNKIDGILCMFMAHEKFWRQGSEQTVYAPYKEDFTTISLPTSFDGYVPKNKKLWSAPYCSLLVKTPTNAAEFGYEYFQNANEPKFRMTFGISTTPSILLEPLYYKTDKTYIGEQIEANYTQGITLEGFPKCAFNVDTFKAWLAQNGATLAVNGALAVGGLIGTLIAGVGTSGYSEAAMLYPSAPSMGAALSDPWTMQGPTAPMVSASGPPQYMGTEPTSTFQPSAGGIMGSLGAIGNILAQIYQHSTLPDQARGAINSDSQYVAGRLNFIFCQKMIRPEFAKIIDDFFSRFGYATHKLKYPNIHVRENWTYTKTVDCEIMGNVPVEAKTEIKSIFNHGITFWNNPNNVGNYSLSNNPL